MRGSKGDRNRTSSLHVHFEDETDRLHPKSRRRKLVSKLLPFKGDTSHSRRHGLRQRSAPLENVEYPLIQDLATENSSHNLVLADGDIGRSADKIASNEVDKHDLVTQEVSIVFSDEELKIEKELGKMDKKLVNLKWRIEKNEKAPCSSKHNANNNAMQKTCSVEHTIFDALHIIGPASSSTNDAKMARSFRVPYVCYSFPLRKTNVHECIEDFCFPQGVPVCSSLSDQENGNSNDEEFKMFVFVLSGGGNDGQIAQYACCMYKWILIDEEENDLNAHYVQICYCFISRIPYIGLLSYFLKNIIDYQASAVNTKGRDATSIVSDLDGNLSSILQNIQAIKIPSIGNSIRIRMFSTGDPGFLFSRVPTENYTDEAAMLLLKWGIPLLLAHMSLKNLLQVLGCLLVEMRVVVICGRLELLSATVMCLASLLRPLIWAGPLITILPPSLREYIEAPVPYLIGIQDIPSNLDSAPGTVIVFPARDVVMLHDADVEIYNTLRMPQCQKLYHELKPYAAIAERNALGTSNYSENSLDKIIRSIGMHIKLLIDTGIVLETMQNGKNRKDLIQAVGVDSYPYMERMRSTQLFQCYVEVKHNKHSGRLANSKLYEKSLLSCTFALCQLLSAVPVNGSSFILNDFKKTLNQHKKKQNARKSLKATIRAELNYGSRPYARRAPSRKNVATTGILPKALQRAALVREPKAKQASLMKTNKQDLCTNSKHHHSQRRTNRYNFASTKTLKPQRITKFEKLDAHSGSESEAESQDILPATDPSSSSTNFVKPPLSRKQHKTFIENFPKSTTGLVGTAPINSRITTTLEQAPDTQLNSEFCPLKKEGSLQTIKEDQIAMQLQCRWNSHTFNSPNATTCDKDEFLCTEYKSPDNDISPRNAVLPPKVSRYTEEPIDYACTSSDDGTEASQLDSTGAEQALKATQYLAFYNGFEVFMEIKNHTELQRHLTCNYKGDTLILKKLEADLEPKWTRKLRCDQEPCPLIFSKNISKIEGDTFVASCDSVVDANARRTIAIYVLGAPPINIRMKSTIYNDCLTALRGFLVHESLANPKGEQTIHPENAEMLGYHPHLNNAALPSYCNTKLRQSDQFILSVFKRRLREGINVIKHDRHGRPNPRVIYTNNAIEFISWRKTGKTHPWFSRTPHANYGEKDIVLNTIVNVVEGNHSNIRYRKHNPLYYSIVGAKRSLDLEALNEEDFLVVCKGLKLLLRQ